MVTYPEVVAHEAVYKGVNHAVSIGKPMACEVCKGVNFAFMLCLVGSEVRNEVVN
jgi:hypothetical protein